MSSIVKAVGDLLQSLVELAWSFVTTAGNLAQNTINFMLRSCNEVISLAFNFFRGLVDLAGGLASFLLGTLRPAMIP